MIDTDDLVMMMDRVRRAINTMSEVLVAQSVVLTSIAEATERPIMVPPAQVTVPPPPPVVPLESTGDLRGLLHEIVGEIAAGSQRTDRVLDALVERFELLAEKLSESRPLMPVGGGGARDGLHVRDFFRLGEALASQAGADGVLTFTFDSTVSLIVVRSVGADAYADPFGGTPADGTGILLADAEPAYIPIQTSEVQVYAPTGATVHVYGLAYHRA